MKKLVVIIALFFSLTAKADLLVYNTIDFEYTQFVYDVCNDLGIDKTIHLVETSAKVHGYVRRVGLEYVIYINKTEFYKKNIIAHELVHVKQDINKVWDINSGTTRMTENGPEYVSKKAKAIEQEADMLGEKLFKKYGLKRRKSAT